MLTDTRSMPAAFIATASASSMPRPPVVMVGFMSPAFSARTMSRKPSCRYASPPISTTSRVPMACSWATTSSACAVESSSGRATPAREPQ